ncbi:hypothetical protein DENSPDRAFT_279676 [Dentipellis sp. KUC8613]|nr:hypothetical protein DENSPDRAFT_279676 [Dentipellis sp. KUC8613]
MTRRSAGRGGYIHELRQEEDADAGRDQCRPLRAVSLVPEWPSQVPGRQDAPFPHRFPFAPHTPRRMTPESPCALSTREYRTPPPVRIVSGLVDARSRSAEQRSGSCSPCLCNIDDARRRRADVDEGVQAQRQNQHGPGTVRGTCYCERLRRCRHDH